MIYKFLCQLEFYLVKSIPYSPTASGGKVGHTIDRCIICRHVHFISIIVGPVTHVLYNALPIEV